MEMWCYRRMLKIPWTEFVSNETVLGKVKEERQILTTITQRQLKFFGHVVRENGLEKLVLEGKIDGLRSRGRQRKKYLDDLVAAVGCLRKGELFHLTQDRERFKCIVANVNWYGTRRRRWRLMRDDSIVCFIISRAKHRRILDFCGWVHISPHCNYFQNHLEPFSVYRRDMELFSSKWNRCVSSNVNRIYKPTDCWKYLYQT